MGGPTGGPKRATSHVPMGKGQKQKKGQTLSLAEFASDAVAADPMALPTAPREAWRSWDGTKRARRALKVSFGRSALRFVRASQVRHCRARAASGTMLWHRAQIRMRT